MADITFAETNRRTGMVQPSLCRCRTDLVPLGQADTATRRRSLRHATRLVAAAVGPG